MFKKKEDLDQLKTQYDELHFNFINLEIQHAKKKQKLDSDLSEWFVKEREAISDRIVKAKQAVADLSLGLEHDYHNAIEKRNTEIARLDAAIAMKKEYMQDTNKHNAYYEAVTAKLLDILGRTNGAKQVISENIPPAMRRS